MSLIRKSIFSFAFGPLLLLPALSIIYTAESVLNGNEIDEIIKSIAAGFVIGGMGLHLVYMVAIGYGLPVVLLLNHHKKLKLINVLASCIPAGFVIAKWFGYGSSKEIIGYIYLSMAVALGVWLIWRKL